jgi:hypothetical protein
MSDTLELLEAIGRDASLRHASSEELSGILRQAKASEALTAAVSSGDRAHLATEFGQNANYQPQSTQSPAHEEEDGADESDAPTRPDREKSPADSPTK